MRTDLNSRLATLEISERERDKRYLQTYRPICHHFANMSLAEGEPAPAQAGVILVYSWMGRGELKPECLERYEGARPFLAAARGDGAIGSDSIREIVPFVSGSLVAASKFLHFLAPEAFAIWDTRVARAAYGRGWHHVNKVESYCRYLDDLRQLTLPAGLERQINAILGEVSPIRVKEFALFMLDVDEDAKRRPTDKEAR